MENILAFVVGILTVVGIISLISWLLAKFLKFYSNKTGKTVNVFSRYGHIASITPDDEEDDMGYNYLKNIEEDEERYKRYRHSPIILGNAAGIPNTSNIFTDINNAIAEYDLMLKDTTNADKLLNLWVEKYIVLYNVLEANKAAISRYAVLSKDRENLNRFINFFKG